MKPETKQPTREEFVKSLFLKDEVDNIYDDKTTRENLVSGIEKIVSVVAPSYGATGSNVMLEHIYQPFFEVTNDGKKIVDAIKLADPIENMAHSFIKEATNKSDRESGNGRKTTILLAGAILKEGLKDKGSVIELRNSLNECLPIIIASLNKQSKEINAVNVSDVARVASGSEEIGQLFKEIYTQIGKDGILEIDNSNTPITTYEITEGVRLRGAGFTWPYMANDEKGVTAIYNNPHILITKEKVSSVTQLDSLYKRLSQKGINELVIFCDEIDLQASQMIAQAHNAGIFKTLVIKAPTIWKDYIYEDFAKITGATIINPAEGTSFKNLQLDMLGKCVKILTTKDETVVLGIQDISNHIEVLKGQSLEGNDDAKRRLAWLQTKTAILKLGANSDTELASKRGKATDARNSSYLALQEGVVAGGGISLLNASHDLPDTIGGNVLRKALEVPFNQILINADYPTIVPYETKTGKKSKNTEYSVSASLVSGNVGFDSLSGEIVDMFKAGIVDSTVVVRNAITNALSIVSNILTVKPSITLKK